MENFDVKSFWFILWHFNFHPFFQNLAFSLVIPASLYFDFHGLFSLLRSRGANKKIWYDIIVKNAFLSSHKNVLLQCSACKGFCEAAKKEDRSGKNKKSASLERLKCHYSISVVLFRGEFRARYRHTRNFFLFTFLSRFHPILDALFTSEWGSRRLGYGKKNEQKIVFVYVSAKSCKGRKKYMNI